MFDDDTFDQLLDILREHGWSETGPGHDPARWLRAEFSARSEMEADLRDDLERIGNELSEWQEAHGAIQEEVLELKAKLDDKKEGNQ